MSGKNANTTTAFDSRTNSSTFYFISLHTHATYTSVSRRPSVVQAFIAPRNIDVCETLTWTRARVYQLLARKKRTV